MKKLNLTIILSILISIPTSFAQIASSDLDNLKKDLNKLLGKRYYILQNYTSRNEITVIILKRFDVTRDGNITYYEYPENMLNYLSNNMNKSYNFKIKFEIAPYVPPILIDDAIRKEKIKLILFSSLIGVVALFLGFIIYRRFSFKS